MKFTGANIVSGFVPVRGSADQKVPVGHFANS